MADLREVNAAEPVLLKNEQVIDDQEEGGFGDEQEVERAMAEMLSFN